jgi:hypothetical protein
MFTSAKASKRVDNEDTPLERRESNDRRTSNKETRFPFIDDNARLVMKNRRKEDRRAADVSITKSPLKIVNKLFKK